MDSQTASVKEVARELPVLPGVSRADRGSPSLVMIEEDPMFVHERVLGGIEKKLGRAPMNAASPLPTNISIGRERTVIVVGGEFTAVNPAAFIIEGRLNKRRSELAFIESRMRTFVKRIEADIPTLHDLLGNAGVEIISALGTNR